MVAAGMEICGFPSSAQRTRKGWGTRIWFCSFYATAEAVRFQNRISIAGCLEKLCLAQKLRNRADHRLLLVFAQFGKDGQGQNLARRALRFRKTSLAVAQTLQRLL